MRWLSQTCQKNNDCLLHHDTYFSVQPGIPAHMPIVYMQDNLLFAAQCVQLRLRNKKYVPEATVTHKDCMISEGMNQEETSI